MIQSIPLPPPLPFLDSHLRPAYNTCIPIERTGVMNKRVRRRKAFPPTALLLLSLLLAGGLSALAPRAATAAATLQSKIAWNNSFATATKKAKASNKLIMVDFYADW